MRGRRGLVSHVVRVWGLRRIYSTVLDWDSLQISHDVPGASAVKHEDSPRSQFYLVDCLPSWILLEYFSVLKLTLRPRNRKATSHAVPWRLSAPRLTASAHCCKRTSGRPAGV